MLGDRLARAVLCLPAHWHARYFDVVDSTQDEARAAARDGAPDRSVFVADLQRAGRGRQGRSWLAAPGSALLLSIVFRELGPLAARPWHFTSLASMALVGAIERWPSDDAVAIKWPNDVMLGDNKVAGILAETSFDGRELIAIVGVGVNISAAPAIQGATHLGDGIDRGDFLLAFVDEIDARRALTHEQLRQLWTSRLWRRSQRVHLLDIDCNEEVVIVGVDPDGSLRVRAADGQERTTSTGELLA